MCIADTEVPNLKCIYNQTVKTDKGKPTAIVRWNDPVVTDNSGNVSVTCDAQSGAEFTIGETRIPCEAVDGSGNKASCYSYVIVRGNSLCVQLLYFRCLSCCRNCLRAVERVTLLRFLFGMHPY